MSNSNSFFSLDDDEHGEEAAAKPQPQQPQQKEVLWKVVAQLPGITLANILVGRLQAEGIPARAWQEGAGQAIGLTVGLLGTGYVVVPEAYEEEALAILQDEAEMDEDWDEWDEEE